MRIFSTIGSLVFLAGCATGAATSAPPGPAPAPQVTANSPLNGVSAPPANQKLELTLDAFPGPGKTNLGALHGKVVLVDIWATWCGPCHAAATAYEQIYNQLHARGVEVIGLSIDEDGSQIPAFLAQQGVTYPIVIDPGAQVVQGMFELSQVPTTLIVDRAGVIRFRHGGYNEAELAKMKDELNTLLAEPAPAS